LLSFSASFPFGLAELADVEGSGVTIDDPLGEGLRDA